jgi:hypothetical protein
VLEANRLRENICGPQVRYSYGRDERRDAFVATASCSTGWASIASYLSRAAAARWRGRRHRACLDHSKNRLFGLCQAVVARRAEASITPSGSNVAVARGATPWFRKAGTQEPVRRVRRAVWLMSPRPDRRDRKRSGRLSRWHRRTYLRTILGRAGWPLKAGLRARRWHACSTYLRYGRAASIDSDRGACVERGALAEGWPSG